MSTYNDRRKEVYRYLRSMGYAPSEARALRNRLKLSEQAKSYNEAHPFQPTRPTKSYKRQRKPLKQPQKKPQKQSQKPHINVRVRNSRATYRMLRDLGLSSKSASKYKTSTYKALDLYFNGILQFKHPILTYRLNNYPGIPIELYETLLRYFSRLNEHNIISDLGKDISLLTLNQLIEAIIRAKAFHKKVGNTHLIDKYIELIQESSDLEDFYNAMGEVSSKIIIVT